MKKLLSIILMLAIIVTTTAFATDEQASAIPSKVEISFRVGDSILSINGADVEVETPYIAGEGTTLVPIRVITEAFGAKVGWIAESKTITLEYPDVNITLQIDNTTAVVNTHTETLAVAPVLSPNGITMVPLRFISETFGAEVGWDAATSSITVTKEVISEGETVTDAVKLPMLGDSYYQWTMETPKNMLMSDRSFDGMYTEFTDDNENKLALEITKCGEDYSFDEDFANAKEAFDGYTFMKADKLKDSSGNPYMHFKIKNKENFLDYRSYYFNNYTYNLLYSCPSDSNTEQLSDILDSFVLSFTASGEVYDLSNVEDGYRLFSDEKMKISLKIPENWKDVSDEAENEFAFESLESENTHNHINIGIYSKSDTVTAKVLAEKDYLQNSKYANSKVYTFTPVAAYMSPGGKYAGYYYSSEIKGSSGNDRTMKDIFFESGDYVYNVAVYSDIEADFESEILGSITVEPLKESEVGTYIRNDFETDGTVNSKAGNWSLTLPISWSKLSETNTAAAYVHKSTASLVTMSVSSAGKDLTDIDLYNAVYNYQLDIVANTSNRLEQATKGLKLNKNNYYVFGYSTTVNGNKIYYISYYRLADYNIYQFTLSTTEPYYSKATLTEFEEIVKTLTVN